MKKKVYVKFEGMGFLGFEFVKWVWWRKVKNTSFELPLKLEVNGGG